ncbi:major facilitator superfamily domain-containing protein 1-like [Ylistrum balloti]|uniref:major facilitator superfamily domain-containing protein 1-like n=1 Tax=Ylistrum balloti TaxID=509963 RepID=UPI002905B429|nr:major facilitator superfamily domain-containing protein 1-like [Ylistrum balloti]
MEACWKYGMFFCNSFMIIGAYYFMELPVGLQNEIMNSRFSYMGSNNTSNRTDCKLCLGFGEVRYNVLFAISRWTSAVLCLPLGFLIDKLGNGRSAILFSLTPLIGSILFALGAMSHTPVTTPTYILMVVGYGLLAFAYGTLRFVKARVIAHCFPDSTFIGIAFSSLGYTGQAMSLYLSPYVAVHVGAIAAAWLATAACGFGVLCAVGLALLLKHQVPKMSTDSEYNKMLTLSDLRALPGSYWFFIMTTAFSSACWTVKQANLPDYLVLRHGYTMEEASHITGIPSIMNLLTPFLCILLRKVDSDGLMNTGFLAWLLIFYALLGFCPALNVYVIAIADGFGVTMSGVMMWQVLLDLSPASHVGTLGGLMFLFRSSCTALIFVVSGYILKRHQVLELNEALLGYQNLFILLVTLSSIGVISGVLMNILDFRKDCALNSTIRGWRQSNIEAIGLMSMIQPSSKYSGIDNINNDTLNDDTSSRNSTKSNDE